MHVLLCYKEVSCIYGYHLYQNIQTKEVGKSLVCENELLNFSDRHASKDDVAVGH